MSEAGDKFKEAIHKYWPKTKVQLEKAAEQAKILIEKGEKGFKQVSDKSVKETKKISLNIKKEKLLHDLGKLTAKTPMSRWPANKAMSDLVREIKALERAVKGIK